MASRYIPELGSDDVPELAPLVGHVLRSRVGSTDADELTQEVLERVVRARPRLSTDTLVAYAVVTARNVAVSHQRQTERHRRHLPRLIDLRTPVDPADEAVRLEEVTALRQALDRLPASERDVLVAHELSDIDTATLAAQSGSTPGGVASRLNRVRARLRVEYVLTAARTTLPSPRCYPVLLALSAADQRRQHALDASGHLAGCPTCSRLSAPLIERSRAELFVLPGVVVLRMLRRPGRWVRHHPVHAAGGTVTAGGAGVLAAVLIGSAPVPHPPAPVPPPPTVAAAAEDLVGGGGVPPTPATGALAVPGAVGAVLFTEDGDVLDRSALQVVTQAARQIRQMGSVAVTVIGYTDSTGDSPSNRQLSLQRADAVMTALEQQLPGTRAAFRAEAYGQAQPLASNATPHGRQLNRRVVIQVG